MTLLNPTKRQSRFGQHPTIKKSHVSGLVVVLALVPLFTQSVQQLAVTAAAGGEATLQPAGATMGSRITVQVTGPGDPLINLRDGREVLAAYSGPAELTRALEQNQARPLSLASADYDEDGVPDLISAYSGPSGGIITVHRGNVDSIYPNSPEAKQRRAEGTFTEAPFLSPALVFGMPEATDFVGAGDFDGDRHWDVVAASRGSDHLYLLAGNGKGSFRAPKQVELPGTVTTMVTGEINRADGLEDVVVGIRGSSGAKVLVFEGPDGALRANPEVINLPAEATSLALGQFYDEYNKDLAIAAGHELIVVLGRHRKLSMDVDKQAGVPKALVKGRYFGSPIISVAVGDFTGNRGTDLALLSGDGSVQLLTKADMEAKKGRADRGMSEWTIETLAPASSTAATQLIRARISNSALDNVVVVGTQSNNLQILSKETKPLLARTQAVAVLPMRLNDDALNDLVVLTSEQSAPSVVPTAPTDRLVVTNTDDKGVGSLRAAIVKANASSGAAIISFAIPSSGVPRIRPQRSLPVITGAVTIDGTTQAGGWVELDGTEAGGDVNGLEIKGGNSVVRGMVINKFGPKRDPGGIIIIPIDGASAGISLRSNGGNIIEGNLIGTDVNGAEATEIQGIGIVISGSSDNLIGGTTSQARNILSGNVVAGLTMTSIELNKFETSKKLETTRNKVQGNFISTDVTGTHVVIWSFDGIVGGFPSESGVRITNGPFGNLVGGTTPGAGNLISGAFDNILIFDATDNLVQGNLIGTVTEGPPNGPTTESQANFPTKDTSIPSALDFLGRKGVIIADPDGPAASNTVGGTTLAARNLISNQAVGIEIVNTQSTGNLIQGNHITGNGVGVTVADSPETTIGGASSGAGNIISGNGDGVTIGFGQIVTRDPKIGGEPTVQTFVGQEGATVQGNTIETNTGSGVFVETDSFVNTIKENRIAFNGGNGVSIPNVTTNGSNSGVRIAVTSNFIFSNATLGIDLGGDNLVTANDSLDADTGANFLQNFPVLNPSSSSPITGTLNSTPNSTFTIEFFFANGCSSITHQLTGPAAVALGSITVTTNGSGEASYVFPFTLPAGSNGFINATATDVNGNTSEFSQCIAVSST